MSPRFPFPEDEGGDVKNLVGSPGYLDPLSGKLCNNDSIWIDIGAPVLTAPDGRKYKMLVAPMILEMDGRLNVNADNRSFTHRNLHVAGGCIFFNLSPAGTGAKPLCTT